MHKAPRIVGSLERMMDESVAARKSYSTMGGPSRERPQIERNNG